MSTIRTKFVCTQITQTTSGHAVQMVAVTSGSEENKVFAKATPAGSFFINIDNPDLQGKLKPGQEYYLDIIEAK